MEATKAARLPVPLERLVQVTLYEPGGDWKTLDIVRIQGPEDHWGETWYLELEGGHALRLWGDK